MSQAAPATLEMAQFGDDHYDNHFDGNMPVVSDLDVVAEIAQAELQEMQSLRDRLAASSKAGQYAAAKKQTHRAQPAPALQVQLTASSADVHVSFHIPVRSSDWRTRFAAIFLPPCTNQLGKGIADAHALPQVELPRRGCMLITSLISMLHRPLQVTWRRS